MEMAEAGPSGSMLAPVQPPSLAEAPSSSRGPETTAAAAENEVAKAETQSSDADKEKKRKEDEEKLVQIYENLSFGGLWDKLSESLSRMEGDSSAAMILLPLIEVSWIGRVPVETPELTQQFMRFSSLSW